MEAMLLLRIKHMSEDFAADYQVEEGIKYLREVKTTLHPFVVKAPSVGSYT